MNSFGSEMKRPSEHDVRPQKPVEKRAAQLRSKAVSAMIDTRGLFENRGSR